MKSRMRENKGFSLVELMVVLVILAVGVIPTAFIQTRTRRDVSSSGRLTKAINIAQTEMEKARSLGFNLAVSDSGSSGIYSWKTEVRSAQFGLKSVKVTVEWMEKGDHRSVEFENLLSMR